MPFGLPDTILTTELDAVNFVMKAKGLDLVTSIDLNDAEIADAAFHLNVADLGFQGKGWYFNKDYCLQLPIAGDGTVPLPVGTLGVAAAYWDGGYKNLTERQGKLYDLDNRTFDFTGQDAPVVDITVRLLYEDMPDVARRYVATLGAHTAQGLDKGNTTAIQITQQMVNRALAEVEWKQDEARPNNQVHQNISVQGAINGFGGMVRSRTT